MATAEELDALPDEAARQRWYEENLADAHVVSPLSGLVEFGRARNPLASQRRGERGLAQRSRPAKLGFFATP